MDVVVGTAWWRVIPAHAGIFTSHTEAQAAKGDESVWWTGWGLVFVIFLMPVGVGLGAGLGAGLGSNAGGETGQHVGTIVGGILMWLIGRYVNRDVLYVHPEGNEYLPRNRHTLHSIPVQYWAVAAVLWGIGGWIFGWEW
ncbi:hypothetical protein [Streptomyces sp. enrichment culture]|uniref:hypothetical protein n=1 Tax=Streptomyces sp. enrichment culture TaxID=1795815 RepID=UPI003F569337